MNLNLAVELSELIRSNMTKGGCFELDTLVPVLSGFVEKKISLAIIGEQERVKELEKRVEILEIAMDRDMDPRLVEELLDLQREKEG